MSRASRLHILAFFSGAAALAYEVSWTRLLSLTFGSSTLAVSTAVAGFMGGMGLGAWLYHRFEPKGAGAGAALRAYAVIEVGIALSAAGLTPLLLELPPWFAAAAAQVPDGGAMTTVRILSGLGILALPTALMGATYPALCAAAIADRDALDRHLGALYGWNTVGAACGALAAGVFAIPELGVKNTIWIGVAVNLAIAVAAFIVARSAGAAPSAVATEVAPEGLRSTLPVWLTGSVLAASGFATLAYEIVWFRALRYLVGNSTFAFTTILVVFLLGLGFGALGLRRIALRGRAEGDLARVQIGIALLAALAIGVEARLVGSDLGYAVSTFNPDFQMASWWLRLLVHGGLALCLMLPATLLMGLSFPLASRLFIGDLGAIGRRVGVATLLANVGGIAGSIGAAVWLLPSFGSLDSTRLLIALNVAIGCAVFAAQPLPAVQRLRNVAAGVALAAVVAGLALPERIDFVGGGLGVIERRLIFEEEGDLATVQVSEAVDDPTIRGITIDGTTIGVTSGWNYPIYSKQRLLAHLPLVLESRIRSVVQIGLGSASTLEALVSHPQLERIHAVEISAAVVRGSRFFEAAAALEDPRVELFVEDALHHLLRLAEPVDLIVSDGKQNDDFSGNAKMLSLEFYELARDRLSADGLFVQWLGLGMHAESFSVVLRTAAEVFPYVDVFYDLPSTALLVAGNQPLDAHQPMSALEYHESPAALDLRALGITSRDVLRYGWIADRAAIVQLVAPEPLNVWDRTVVEYVAYRVGRPWQLRPAALNLERLIEANALARARAPRDFVSPNADRQRSIALVREAYVALLSGDAAAARVKVAEARALRPADPIARRAERRIR